jgi:SAM-dependent methyltransferase
VQSWPTGWTRIAIARWRCTLYDDLMGDHRTVIEFGSGPWPVLELFPIVERRISIDPLNTGFFAAGMHDYRYLYELHQTAEPIPAETADLVLALNMIDHTDEPRQVIADMRRVAKHGAGLRLWKAGRCRGSRY